MLVVASEDVVGERARETRDAVGGAGVRGIGDAGGDPVRQGPRVEVDEVGDALVEEGTVVAREQHRAGPRQEHRCEQLRATIVEVVGRLVEQQRLRAGEQDAREFDAASLTTRERAQRLGEDALVEGEAARDRRGLRLRGVPAGGGELGVEARVALHRLLAHGVVLGGHVRLGGAQVARDGVKAARGQDAVAGEDVEVAGAWILRQVADLAGGDDAARCGDAVSGEHLRQRRLAGSVAPDEADAVARGDTERRVLEQDARAGAQFDAFGGDHG